MTFRWYGGKKRNFSASASLLHPTSSPRKPRNLSSIPLRPPGVPPLRALGNRRKENLGNEVCFPSDVGRRKTRPTIPRNRKTPRNPRMIRPDPRGRRAAPFSVASPVLGTQENVLRPRNLRMILPRPPRQAPQCLRTGLLRALRKDHLQKRTPPPRGQARHTPFRLLHSQSRRSSGSTPCRL